MRGLFNRFSEVDELLTSFFVIFVIPARLYLVGHRALPAELEKFAVRCA